LLQLLSGTALYGDPLIAVRELVQNAFDAVREKIACGRLDQRSPSDPLLASKIGEEADGVSPILDNLAHAVNP
jgi:HSP90 family molecular chaperone